MEKVKDVWDKLPRLVRSMIIWVVVVTLAVVVDCVAKGIIYKNVYEVVEDDFSHVFQVDNLEVEGDKLILTGWVFELDKDSSEADFEIILYDYNRDKDYYTNVEDVVREDVNEYFLCEYDYSDSGFIASTKLRRLDLEEKNYEVLIRPMDTRKAYKTGIYISKGEMMYVKPEDYVALDVEGTDLETIISDGTLRVYRPDVGMYVYQYEGDLYWIADESYEFEEDGSTRIQYFLRTTQMDRLPQHRLDENETDDSRGGYFEKNELTDANTGKYRVMKLSIPNEYSITRITTGCYEEKWVWRQYFKPIHEF